MVILKDNKLCILNFILFIYLIILNNDKIFFKYNNYEK